VKQFELLWVGKQFYGRLEQSEFDYLHI